VTRPTAPYPAEPTHGQAILAELRRRRDRRTIGERVYLVALIVVTVVCIFILATNGALA